ncbi:amino acid ABC transporter substrate-binding protein [Rhodospirillaceae bacterium SYSU D60014]|uniref:amino acid ABC transporter substrate-binding protein n=1 Tax=Virgifigura deserti TaxID=2268457 RepID=UPI000E66B160
MVQLKMLTAGIAGVVFSVVGAAGAATLDEVKSRGYLQCGVNTGLPGFSAPDDQGNWRGLDVDVCRAVAAAVFGDSEAVRYTPTNAKERFTALQSGAVDVLSRNTTWTLSRDSDLNFEFVGVNYYDGQGFMVPKDLGVSSALELDGAAVCVQSGTTTEKNLGDYFRANGMELRSVVYETSEQAVQAYIEGRCDAFTTDASGLAAERSALAEPDAHIILPEIISKEPLGPLVRQGDNEWADIVRWSLNAMIAAEEYGVSSQNVDEVKAGTDNPEVRRLLGVEDKMGEMLGLSNDWAYNIIKQVGNYGESFERNVGLKTPLALARGLNEQWTKGGILYAPPVR